MPKRTFVEAVTFGIRPEHIAREAEAGPSSHPLSVDIVRIEALGAETIAVAQIPGIERSVLARFAGVVDCRVGERWRLAVDLQKAHLFATDGRALQS